jgi:rubrerythrin
MDERTQFEKDFKIDLSRKNFNILRAVEVGMKIEKMGKQFYELNAKKLDPETRAFFEFLAKEELKHLNLLKKLRVRLLEKAGWFDLKEDREVYKWLDRVDAFKKKLSKKSTGVEPIILSIENEKKTRDYYQRLADNLEDPEGKEFFLALARWEATHFELLSGILEAETEFRMQS